MKNYIESYRLWESNQFPMGMRLAKPVDLTDSEIRQIEEVDWKELDWNEAGDDGKNIVWLDLISPFNENIRNGVIVDIQLIGDHIYQVHISLADSLQGMGLGSKIYRSLVNWAGHLYSGKGRRHNPLVNKIWKGLKDQTGVMCISSTLGDICISNNNPDKDLLASIFNRISS